MEDEAEPNPIVPTPWCLFGFFLGIQKEARRPQAAKPLRSIVSPVVLVKLLNKVAQLLHASPTKRKRFVGTLSF